MFVHILYWYVIVSYVVGFSLFALDVTLMLIMRSRAIKVQKHTGMNLSRHINVGPAIKIGLVVTLFAPLTAWHGALHYLAVAWAKIQNKPVKYWL